MKRYQTLHEGLIPALVAELGFRRYLELGCYDNSTIQHMPSATGNGAVFAVDKNEPPYRMDGVVYRIMMTSDYIRLHAKDDGPFDAVFIDADHSYESAMSDFLGIWPYVSPEGLIMLHDTNPERMADTHPGACGDSWVLAKWLNSSGYESVTLPYHPGLTIVRKRASWGPVDYTGPQDIPGLTAGKEPHASRV